MNRIGVLTYNSVGYSPRQKTNGWHENEDRRVFICSHPKGKDWLIEGIVSAQATAPIAAQAVQERFTEITSVIDNLEHLFVYVGDSGSEGAIKLASQLPADRVTFVFCDCNLGFKRAAVRAHNMTGSGEILCECGGVSDLGRIVDNFLATGILPSPVNH